MSGHVHPKLKFPLPRSEGGFIRTITIRPAKSGWFKLSRIIIIINIIIIIINFYYIELIIVKNTRPNHIASVPMLNGTEFFTEGNCMSKQGLPNSMKVQLPESRRKDEASEPNIAMVRGKSDAYIQYSFFGALLLLMMQLR